MELELYSQKIPDEGRLREETRPEARPCHQQGTQLQLQVPKHMVGS